MKLDAGERDVHRFMRNLEDSLINVLAGYGIDAERQEKLTGVWTKHGKIGAMGVHISRWITRHGFALNVNTELSYFDLIGPCGIAGKGVASMQSILGRALDLRAVAERYAPEFAVAFARTMVWASQDDLQQKLQCHARENPVA
jgi:lipoyl(octanoyl) transferase